MVVKLTLAIVLLATICLCEDVQDEPQLQKKFENAILRKKIIKTPPKNLFRPRGYSKKESSDKEPPFSPSPECGQHLTNLSSGSFGTIMSPRYPRHYLPDMHCEWIIQGAPGTVVEATFYDIFTQPWTLAFFDYVMVSLNGKWEDYRRFAGDANSQMPFTFVSNGSTLGVRFVSSTWLNFRGFKMFYVVRDSKASDVSPPENEYGSAYNNDLTATCVDGSEEPFPERNNSRRPKFPLQRKLYVQNSTHEIIRIVNGIQTVPHEYPFVVAMLIDDFYFCSGSLIDNRHVLTTASCVEDAEKILLIFGLHNIQNRAEILYSRQIRRIVFPDVSTYVVTHPNYEPDSGAHDIAIVRLPQPVVLTAYVQPVYLPSMYSASNSFHGWTLTTVGWGSTIPDEEEANLSPVLRKASAVTITMDECREEFFSSITGNNMCSRTPVLTEDVKKAIISEVKAGYDDSGDTVVDVEYESPCHGDAGAPLFAEFAPRSDQKDPLNNASPSKHNCVLPKRNGVGPMQTNFNASSPHDEWYVQLGIVSGGSSVCGKETPVVYTRITAYLEWIFYMTGRHGRFGN